MDDGIWRGYLNAADVLFLIAAVAAGLSAGIRWSARAWDAALAATAVTLLAVAWLIL